MNTICNISRATIILTILFTQTCCEIQPYKDPVLNIVHIDESFNYYLEKIEPYLASRTVSLQFANHEELTATQAGVCNINKNTIFISEDKWMSYDETKRTALIAHELIHCVMKVTHVHSSVNDAFQLMSPYLTESTRCLQRYGLESCIDTALNQIDDGSIRSVYER